MYGTLERWMNLLDDRAHFWDQINLPPPDECQTYLASLTGGRWPRIRGYTG